MANMNHASVLGTWGLICFLAVVGQTHSAVAQGVAQQQDAATAHRFFDAANLALVAAESGALLADGITTQHLLNAGPPDIRRCADREKDPIARPFVCAGWPGQIVGGALFVSSEVGLRYLLHRGKHHRIERWLPSVLIAYGTVGAVHNARIWIRYERLYTALRK